MYDFFIDHAEQLNLHAGQLRVNMADMIDTERGQDDPAINFPPGTIRLEDKEGDHIMLSPLPTSDPNDPLARFIQATL